MHLIRLTETTAIDIKRDMSDLDDTLTNNQLNGTIADIVNDVDATNKISPSKNDVLSKSVEDVTSENSMKEQIAVKRDGFNGIAVTRDVNGDVHNDEQILEQGNMETNTEISKENLENGCANDRSEEKSILNQSFKSPAPVNNMSDVMISTISQTLDTDFDDQIDSESNKIVDEENIIVSNDTEVTNAASNDKDISDDIFTEQSATQDSAQVNVMNKNVNVVDKSEEFLISMVSENKTQSAPVLSPDMKLEADEKEINTSAQLQHIKDTASEIEKEIDATGVTISFENISNKIQKQNEDKVASSVCLDEEIEVSMPLQKNINNETITGEAQPKDFADCHDQKVKVNSVIKVSTGKQPMEDKNSDKNIVQEKCYSKEKITICPGLPLKDSSITANTAKAETSLDFVVHVDLDTTAADKAQDKAASEDVFEKQSDVLERINDKTKDADNIKDVPTEELENSTYDDTNVDSTTSVQNYIKDRSFQAMKEHKLFHNDDKTTESSKEKQPTGKDEIQQNNNMEVDETDVTSENRNYPPNLIKKDNNVESCAKNVEDETITETTEGAAEVPTEQHLTKIEPKNSDIVMEIDDIDEIPVVDKSILDTEVVEIKSQNITEVQTCEGTEKQDPVVNISNKESVALNNCESIDIKHKNKESSEVISIDDSTKDEIVVDSIIPPNEIIEGKKVVEEKNTPIDEKITQKKVEKKLPVVCKLLNTMDILSDDEDIPDLKPVEGKKKDIGVPKKEEENKCINLDDDDDIMFIEDTNSQDTNDKEKMPEQVNCKAEIYEPSNKINPDTGENEIRSLDIEDVLEVKEKNNSTPIKFECMDKVNETKLVEPSEIKTTKPLIKKTFLKSVTKNLADMTRNELEDFCILKLVESVVDKSSLNEIKNKMKTMAQTVEDLKKKTMALTKQNRDLQVVVKTVQEDQKKRNINTMMPMKITRSVGIQVVLSGEKATPKRKIPPQQVPPAKPAPPNMQSPKPHKQFANNIPVPRLVPASSPTVKSSVAPVNNSAKTAAPVRNTTPQRPEKRPHKLTSPTSVTVDLTDDEPPAKMATKNLTPPVRLVPAQNLMPVKTRPQFGQTGNSPRKVYIPISSNNPNIRPGTGVIKNFVSLSNKPRAPTVVKMQTVRINQGCSTNRHPAPLPDAMKQYQPPTWKSLPPPPDLKLSKVDNGIVISWKFDGKPPEAYEEIASFQLYAYQETPGPPSTALWKKIGDIKALPLPMACTLTQFMTGFKYFFAVRAIDVRSRIGPFSLPGSIMLISKNN